MFTFSKPVSIPCLFLSVFGSSENQITLNVYSDVKGSNLLGSIFFAVETFQPMGKFGWTQCTNLNSPVFNRQIRRLEVYAPENANLDDMSVETATNSGDLQKISLSLPTTIRRLELLDTSGNVQLDDMVVR